ncbi:flavonol sulfotransferase-like [Pyrus ussuriensis x Pyrus communis]|uniref:Sulfotransferase n=1 Tax=Pyrus ussuriensis x Pyrus communis TaxID=2448454 RepID=A0A5N5I0B3_9ROSA|nr:flavonol sulfotransferase-like [Pyrus ussuriensis x Pyrus communis]
MDIPPPYKKLPKPVNFVCCILMCICRNRKDVLISKWRYVNELRPKELEPLSLEEAFELFCRGGSDVGPFWDHVLGYWKARSEFPDKILFLKYEEMIKDPIVHVTRLAEFLGQPYAAEEESKGVVHQIVKL